ncbi:MAG TPA: CDP-diacylglycerol--serine O-phosphatidyltransferase [Sedimentisphaerales bacterium]|nr:CDP-diacylglycerol--serine O-phosphatidyltransferase [Sedimentisphaerales bacterium]
MPRFKTKAARDRLLRRVRRQRLKSITILPSLITILNGVCGFAAIVFAGKGAFVTAAYMLLLAMIADMLDGRVARMSRTTSSFGGQLDSLCDIISFGVAPAFLMLKLLEFEVITLAQPTLAVAFLRRFVWLAAATYISCAAIRLARFNVENEEDESAHMSFIGLPTPAAAGVIVSLVIFHQRTIPELSAKSTLLSVICENAIIYALPFLVLAVAVLMVSRVRYPHVVNLYIKGKKPLSHLIWLLLVIGLVLWSIHIALAVIFCGFAATGFGKWFFYRVIRGKYIPVQPPEAVDVQQAAASSAQDPINQ